MRMARKKASASKPKLSRKRAPAKDPQKDWEEKAYAAGARSVGWFWPKLAAGEPPSSVQWARQLNLCWAEWFGKHRFNEIPQTTYPLACKRFIRGYCETANIQIHNDLLLPTTKKVGCVITAMNESVTLNSQLNELARLPFEEIIVVINGSSDDSYEVVRNHPGRATIVHFDAALGYDVGRAVGAKVSMSDILLFLDADMSIGVDLLLPFIYEAEKGEDLVLNPISPLLPPADRRDMVSHVKQFLNICTGRKDLQVDSLTAVPHALTRRAIEQIGTSMLAVPPVAYARAIQTGLRITRSPLPVNVIAMNRVRQQQNVGSGNQVEQLIIGDHLEALFVLMEQASPRLQFPDDMRQRHYIQGGRDSGYVEYKPDHSDLQQQGPSH